MNFNEFIEVIKSKVEVKLGDNHLVECKQVLKNNGVTYHALHIRKEGNNTSPTIYLEPFYNIYLNQGADRVNNNLINEITKLYTENIDSPPYMNEVWKFTDYEFAKNKIMYKLINTQQNRELLKKVPNIPYLDLSIVFYLYFGADDNEQYTAMVYNTHKEIWGVDSEIIYHHAMANTQNAFPASIRSLQQIMQEFAQLANLEDFSDNKILEPPIYVLSNTKRVNGAGVLLYANILEGFSEKRGCDLIILPSSTHEVLLIPADNDVDFQELQAMVKDINITEVPAEDRLSDHVYLYERNTNTIYIAA